MIAPSRPSRRVVGFVFIVAAALAARADAAPMFVSHFDVYIGPLDRPLCYSAAAGDVNGDGRDDLVYSASDFSYNGLLCVRLGTTGAFLDSTLRTSVLGSNIGGVRIRLAHVNEDLILDAVVGNFDSVRVLMGIGDGTFASPIRIPAFGNTTEIGIGDLDGDGFTDLIIPMSPIDSVQIMVGDGAGGFVPGARHPVGAYPYYCSVMDADGDPYPDVLVGDEDGSTLLRGTSGGGFAISSVGADRAFSAGDLDDDGFADAISHSEGALLGNGDGTFDAPIPHGMSNPLFVADLDEDGYPDLVGKSNGPQTIAIRLGDGAGGFGPERGYVSWPNGEGFTFGDFDGDGHLDLGKVAEPRLQLIHRGKGNGELVQALTIPLPLSPRWVALGDLDANFIPDLVVTFSVSTIGVALAEAGVSYPTVSLYPAPAPATRVETGDLNGDTRADVIAKCGSTLAVWIANASGTLGSRVDLPLGSSTTDFEVTDLDGDGDLDVVVNGSVGDARIYPGDGSGALGSPAALPLALTGDVDAADLNGDPYLDLVSETSGYDPLVLIANGPLSYVSGQGYPGPVGSSFALAIGRFDQDLIPDIVLDTGAEFYVYPGLGGGLFGAYHVEALTGGSDRSSLRSADFDGDGFDDLAKPGPHTQALVTRSMGDGSFAAFERHGVGVGPAAIAVGDLDGNGRPDIVSVETFHNTATILLNQTLPVSVHVEDDRRVATVLEVRPVGNPVRGDLVLAVDLPGREAFTVDLVDVTGRRIARREWSALAPGRQTLSFGSLAGHSPGILFVRVRQGDRTGTARIALLP